jgi:Co/Zn/Cd efflux system component
MADTLRSIAVFIAAGCAYVFSLNPAIADATASIVVSIVIAISLGPLLLGLAKTIAEIRNLYEGENIIEDDFNDKFFSREQS